MVKFSVYLNRRVFVVEWNTFVSFTVADSNVISSPWKNSSDSSRKQIFRDILGDFSYFIIKLYVVRTH